MPQARNSIPWAWSLLLLAVVALYVLGLGSPYAPTNGDEMVYTHIARLTAASGHWLPLVSDLGAMRNTKPPLLFWQAMLAGGWGDHWSLWALRLPSVLYTLLTAAGVALLTYRLSGRIRMGMLAAVVFLVFFSTFRYGRVYLTSAPETFWLAVPMLWLLLQAHRGAAPAISWRAYACIGVALGIGCAYKSFALVAPALATLWVSVLLLQPRRDWRQLRNATVGCALSGAIALGIFSLWFVLDPDPAAVWREFVVGENAGKLGNGVGYWQSALWGGASIGLHLLAYFENAGLLWFVALGLALALLRHGPKAVAMAPATPLPCMPEPHPGRWPPYLQVLIVWLLVWLFVFAIPSQRSARYVIPAMPALAILLALAWEQLPRLWFRLTLLLLVPALVMLVRIGWVMHDMAIGTQGWLLAVLLTGGFGLCTVCVGWFFSAHTRMATLLACLSVYACFNAMVAPLSRGAALYSPAVQQQLQGATVAVPNGFNAQYERFNFLLPMSTLVPYDTDGRDTGALFPHLPPPERLTRLRNAFDAVVWVQPSLEQSEPSCAPTCRVLMQRWHVKSRHRSGEVTLDNLWYPQQWLFRREWLLAGASLGLDAPDATP